MADKAAKEKREVESLQKTVAAKKAWLLVSELRRQRAELDRVLAALKPNPSLVVGSQLQHRLQSLRKKAHHFDSSCLAMARPVARILPVDRQTQCRVSMRIELLQRLFQARPILKAGAKGHYFGP